MKIYEEFHGEIPISEIGKHLREIAKEGKSFKIMTGFGSVKGISKSKNAALASLSKMKREKIIKEYFPGDIFKTILKENSQFFEAKMKYETIFKKDSDAGNEGIIFVIVK